METGLIIPLSSSSFRYLWGLGGLWVCGVHIQISYQDSRLNYSLPAGLLEINKWIDNHTCKKTALHHTHTHKHTHFQPRLTLTLQWPFQSSAVTPMELISHGSTVHLLPQTLDASHIMLTQNTITSACLHFFSSSSFLWHNKKKKKNTRSRGCPAGCIASSPRFNVNLILSLEMLLSAQQTGRKEVR